VIYHNPCLVASGRNVKLDMSYELKLLLITATPKRLYVQDVALIKLIKMRVRLIKMRRRVLARAGDFAREERTRTGSESACNGKSESISTSRSRI
jgi:hypothetical protein